MYTILLPIFLEIFHLNFLTVTLTYINYKKICLGYAKPIFAEHLHKITQ